MNREYEFTFISRSEIPEADKTKLFEKYEGVLTKGGGQVLKKEDWGVKRMAYPIKKNFRGHYMHYDLTSTAEDMAECERLMRIDENVLRFMSIRIGQNIDIDQRLAELAKKAAEPKKVKKD